MLNNKYILLYSYFNKSAEISIFVGKLLKIAQRGFNLLDCKIHI